MSRFTRLNPLIKSTPVLLDIIICIWHCFIVSIASRLIDCFIVLGFFWFTLTFFMAEKADNLLSLPPLAGVRSTPSGLFWQHHDIYVIGIQCTLEYGLQVIFSQLYKLWAPADAVTTKNCCFQLCSQVFKGEGWFNSHTGNTSRYFHFGFL